MHEIEIITKSLNKIKHTKNTEQITEQLYGLYTYILLNRNMFKRNSDLKNFIEPIFEKINVYYTKDIQFKDYVYKSRSLVIARFIRIIEKSNNNVRNELILNAETLLLDEQKNDGQVNKKRKRKNNRGCVRQVQREYLCRRGLRTRRRRGQIVGACWRNTWDSRIVDGRYGCLQNRKCAQCKQGVSRRHCFLFKRGKSRAARSKRNFIV